MTEHPIARWHKLVEARSAAGLMDLVDEQAVFHSPVVHTPQQGQKLVVMYLTAALHVLGGQSFRYVREIIGANDAVLEFETEMDGIVINGIDLIQWNDAGRIIDFKVMIRPLKALNLVHERMGALIQAHANKARELKS